MNRYYFQVPEANIYECILALSFTEAKKIAFEHYSTLWNQIQWINVAPLSADQSTVSTPTLLPVTITQ